MADLVDPAQCATVEARLADRDRPIELLVNNAGFGLKKRFLDNTIEQEAGMLDVLVTAVLRLSHAALGPMAERGRGGIINVSSVAAFLPRGTYSAAKAWVNSFSEWAHNEYKPQGVTVMALCPGFTKTEFHERMEVKRGDNFMWLDVEFLVRTALADFDKGRTYSVPGAQYKTVVRPDARRPQPGAAALPVDGPEVGLRRGRPARADRWPWLPARRSRAGARTLRVRWCCTPGRG